MSARLQSAGKTGWLYRVVLAGQVSADAPLELVSRLSDVSVYDACARHMPFDDEQYHRLLSAAGLSTSWTRTMQKRRTSRQIEDNSRRLWEIVPSPRPSPQRGEGENRTEQSLSLWGEG